MAVMTKDSAERLALYSSLSKLPNNEYLLDTSNENFQYISERYFDNDTRKAKILNTGSGIFMSVVQTISYFFDKPMTDLRVIEIEKAIQDYITLWFATLIVERDDQGEKIVPGNSQGYVREGGIDKVYKQYSKVDGDGYDEYYLYEKKYLPGRIERALYKLDDKDDFEENYEQVSLDTIEQTRGLDTVTRTGLSKPSIYIVWDTEQSSLIEMIKDVVYSLDRKTVMFDTQFLQNVESITLFKGFTKADAGIKWDTLDLRDRAFFTDVPEADVQFIQNNNELINKAMEYETRQIKRISSMTNIPLRFLGIDEQDGSSGRNARQLTQAAFIKMLNTYKQTFKNIIKNILIDLGMAPIVNFKDTVLRDDYDLAEELKIARESRLISQIEAVKKYQDITTEEAEEEVSKMENEQEQIQLWADSNKEKSNWPRERRERRDQ